MTLDEFLLARIAEDEVTAADKHDRYDCDLHQLETYGDCSCDTPARVLAEAKAKRRIVEAVEKLRKIAEIEDPFGNRGNWDQFDVVCDVLKVLAAVHSDHEDYREAWKI
jgi:hypothetical protein